MVLVALLLIPLLTVDRWLKSLAIIGREYDLGWFHFFLFRNRGLIFSWPLPNVAAAIVMIFALIVVAWLVLRSVRRRAPVEFVAALLLLSGAMSNLYDRLRFGFVVDWAYLGPWWPVFNLADVMIVTGLVVMLWPRRLTAEPS